MSNLKDIKRKIKSVQNTQKTTRAMKLVSTAKLRKAEEAARKSRVYALKINEVLSEISYKINQYASIATQSKFFQKSDTGVADIIFVTADKGLCGGFNIQSIKEVKNLITQLNTKNIKVRLRAVGKKGIEYFNFQGVNLLQSYTGVSSSPTYEKAAGIIKDAVNDYINGDTDRVILVHNGYKNMISQEMRINDIVPIEPPAIIEAPTNSLMEFEPEDENNKILDELLQKYFEYSMYYALVDSLAAEHSARMQAMDNATNNAKERVKQLNLAYNKARQESITTELIEIISGVESMK